MPRAHHTYHLSRDEAEIDVNYDYSPAEPMTRDHPGYPSQVEVFSTKVGGVEIETELTEDELSQIAMAHEEERDD